MIMQSVDTYLAVLFGLLATTGLRIAEALALRFHDVTDDGLVIRESKFHKSRLVPLHPTTTAALEQYLKRRGELAIDDDHLFVSRRRRPLSRTVVYQTFYQLLAAAGIPSVAGRRRPRLIDMRHSFATKALLRCPEDRDQVGCHMLALSTYLGHAHVSSTYWYLENTPQLLSDIAQSCEQFIDGDIS